MIFTAQSVYNDIENCSVADFGIGPGMLSIAAKLMGSSYTVGFDVDQEALDNAWVNCRKLEIYDVDMVQTDIQSLSLNQGKAFLCSSHDRSYLHL
jgi:predicted RNA methylase